VGRVIGMARWRLESSGDAANMLLDTSDVLESYLV
jgi:hypothetical protein